MGAPCRTTDGVALFASTIVGTEAAAHPRPTASSVEAAGVPSSEAITGALDGSGWAEHPSSRNRSAMPLPTSHGVVLADPRQPPRPTETGPGRCGPDSRLVQPGRPGSGQEAAPFTRSPLASTPLSRRARSAAKRTTRGCHPHRQSGRPTGCHSHTARADVRVRRLQPAGPWASSRDLCGGFAVRCHTLAREGTGR